MPPFELLPGGLALLQSALATPRWSYHRTVQEKAAALFRSIVKNHALKDGNKRLGVTALDVFLRINRVDLKASQRNIVETAFLVAAYPGNFPLEVLTSWIRMGCTGRPRRIVGIAADHWPEARAIVMKLVRDLDRSGGRGARIPGRRVRTPATIAREVAKLLEQEGRRIEQQRLALGNGEAPASEGG